MTANGDIKASNYGVLTIARLDRLNKRHLATLAQRTTGWPKWFLAVRVEWSLYPLVFFTLAASRPLLLPPFGLRGSLRRCAVND